MNDMVEQEIRASIKYLKTKEAPGSDNITAEMLQRGGHNTVKNDATTVQ